MRDLLQQLKTAPEGLTSEEAQKRYAGNRANLLKTKKRPDDLTIFLSQFKSPIILILLFAVLLSYFLHEHIDALIILIIVMVSGFLGFWQERGASRAVEKLLSVVQIKPEVLRDSQVKEIPIDEVVPGDIILLKAGDVIPADCRLLESKDLFINEATLTGETYPVEKEAKELTSETLPGPQVNTLLMGTNVVSGTARAVVVYTGKETEFGKISARLRLRPPETEFERGVRRFGYLLMEITLLLVIAIFAINVFLARPVLDSFLFSLALAIGLTPQLLPAIISVNLAHGAKAMAKKKVIIKRLASIENFGSMDVLCSDKTGTLTEGVVELNAGLNVIGQDSEKALFYAFLNASFETGLANPIDVAIRKAREFDISDCRKLDEVPYDFVRKRLSILLSKDKTHLMITKGALANVLAICSSAEVPAEGIVDMTRVQDQIQKLFETYSNRGNRVLGIAYRLMGEQTIITKESETDMIFLGLIVFFDPPKPQIAETIGQLEKLGITLKIITGDNRLVAFNMAQKIGLGDAEILTGSDLHQMTDEALTLVVSDTRVFAEIEPNQKERIILALKKSSHVVGFIGDGLNDVSALHTADVGISVDSGVDAAKDAADIVLLEKDLGVLSQGVQEGRSTFANTLKYVFMATSANFGNMFSLAGASVFLRFLPLLPKQILLLNLLTDFPEMTIATDRVDRQMVDEPRRWNISFIRKFMIVFGLLSSVFDYLTFGVLLFMLQASPAQFRTGWFLESIVSAAVIVLVIRTRKPFFKSIPGSYLIFATFMVIGIAFLIAFTPIGKLFGFGPLPSSFLILLGIVMVLYIIIAEIIKKIFYKAVKF
ncbi:MAG TPA: magnesium-translocating P-type ATPase [bacterium]